MLSPTEEFNQIQDAIATCSTRTVLCRTCMTPGTTATVGSTITTGCVCPTGHTTESETTIAPDTTQSDATIKDDTTLSSGSGNIQITSCRGSTGSTSDTDPNHRERGSLRARLAPASTEKRTPINRGRCACTGCGSTSPYDVGFTGTDVGSRHQFDDRAPSTSTASG
jgi:hypothetical protein